MKGMIKPIHSKMSTLTSLQSSPLLFPFKTPRKPAKISAKSRTPSPADPGIPGDDVRTLAQFRSLHNDIRVLEVSRRADHPFAGSRLLLLDSPGNIHSISFLLKSLTSTYFDVFALLPPLLPPGPLALLGFGAGTAARLLLHLYPHLHLHGWELDPSVVSVANEYFGLRKLKKQYGDRLSIYVGDAFAAEIEGGFAGMAVDLFAKGRVVRELQRVEGWERLRRRLRSGGRVVANCGGRCVESEDGEDGGAVMEETLDAMGRVFGARQVFVLRLGGREDSVLAMTGDEPDFLRWKEGLVEGLKGYVDMWVPLEEDRARHGRSKKR